MSRPCGPLRSAGTRLRQVLVPDANRHDRRTCTDVIVVATPLGHETRRSRDFGEDGESTAGTHCHITERPAAATALALRDDDVLSTLRRLERAVDGDHAWPSRALAVNRQRQRRVLADVAAALCCEQ